MCFQGPTTRQGIRWIGSESGEGPEPNWSMAKSSTDYGPGDADGAVFAPAAADVTLSVNGEWDWRAGQPLKSLQALSELYDNSVGHNANMLLNFGPAFSGLLPSSAMQRYAEFGEWIAKCYGTPLSETKPGQVRSGAAPIVLAVPPDTAVSRIWIMEGQAEGQRIRSFSVDARHASSGEWHTVLKAQSVGHKRIVLMNATRLSAIRVRVLGAVEQRATVRSIAVFAAAPCAVPPAPPAPACEDESGYAFAGNPLGQPLPRTSLAGCCAACCNRSGHACVGFVHDGTGSCTLFKSLGGGKKMAGVVSGAPVWSLKSDDTLPVFGTRSHTPSPASTT